MLADSSRRILALAGGERLTLVGIERGAVAEALQSEPAATRSVLLLEPDGGQRADRILGRILDDLAAVALGCWPRWYGSDAPSPRGLLDRATADRSVSAPWVRAAVRRVAAGYPPRFRRTAQAFEFTQLMRAIDPRGPVLVAAVDPVAPARAAPMIHVLEWCASLGGSVVAVLSAQPPLQPPWDRLLYGALEVASEPLPAAARFIAGRARAHPASLVEQRVEAALRRDAELGPLFVGNEIVPLDGPGLRPRVDLLWPEGRIVVELDGPEHQADQKFADDRHRDYELLVAGYLVLRITNGQVETDLQRAIEKIREVVRFRRSTRRDFA